MQIRIITADTSDVGLMTRIHLARLGDRAACPAIGLMRYRRDVNRVDFPVEMLRPFKGTDRTCAARHLPGSTDRVSGPSDRDRLASCRIPKNVRGLSRTDKTFSSPAGITVRGFEYYGIGRS